jgi:UDP-N-acetylmuramoyl-tripeptide--D-alanyl-D-alanine ligase
MRPLTLAGVARATGAKILQGDPQRQVSAVCTDTRKLSPGELFFALRGERFDAHDFLGQAAAAGAAGLVVSRVPAGLPGDVPVLLVADTLAALQKLARFNRERCPVPLVAVTGSAGKTTVKDMIAAVLESGFPTLKTKGNLNNEIGVPLTLLELDDRHRAAVVEMAMRGPGEIDALCRIALPTAGVVTSVGEAHAERLGSVENIARAKGELLDHIGENGFAFLNAHSPYLREQAARCRGRVFFFGLSSGADVRAAGIRPAGRATQFTVELPGERFAVTLPLPGEHNVLNALAAAGVGWALGLDAAGIKSGLERVSLTGMRTEITEWAGITVINDAYNASPASVRAALGVLAQVAGGRRKIAVLGNMLELGEFARSGHYGVGEAVRAAGVDFLVTVGELARGIAEGAREKGFSAGRIRECADREEAAAVLRELLAPGDVLLVKGSRGMQMEKIIETLKKEN